MGTTEIALSAIIQEQQDGSYKAICPELEITSIAGNSDEAYDNLRETVTKHIKEVGLDKIELIAVKCFKFKVQV